MTLSTLHHVAIPVSNIDRAAKWYKEHFDCILEYQDETWGLLRFQNLRVALVLPEDHPPHIGFFHESAESFGELTTHRDGTRSIYITDSEGNSVELMKPEHDHR